MGDLAADVHIYSLLAADATLQGVIGDGIYEEMAPPENDPPYIIFQLMSPSDVMGTGPYRMWRNELWLVRGVAETEDYTGDLLTIDQRVDALLHGSEGTNAQGQVFACVRERPFRLLETPEGGRQIRHLGGIYRFMAK